MKKIFTSFTDGFHPRGFMDAITPNKSVSPQIMLIIILCGLFLLELIG